MSIPFYVSTTVREESERTLNISTVLAEVWKYRAAAARLKLARLNSFDLPTRRKTSSQIEVARCDLKVKNIERKISVLKENENRRKVETNRKVESGDKKHMVGLKETVEAVKNFDAITKDATKKRDKYFFSYCKQEGHAPWYCMALDKRKNWFEYPSKKWFVTSKGTQLYCPVGNVKMDYSDQHVYSFATADIKGNEHITDKGLLAQLNLPFTPKTYHIRGCKWVGDVPPRLPPGVEDEAKAVWFVKDTLRNYSTGIFMARTREECLRISEEKNSYVVQAQIVPHLIDERKSHIRTYFLMLSERGSEDTRFFMFREGYLALALKKYKFDDLDRDVQVTRDRTCRMSDKMKFYGDVLPQIVSTLCELAAAVKPKLRPDKSKTNFMISGLDLMIDHKKFVWLLEANAGPVVRGADFPTIKSMIDLAIPEGSGLDPEKDIIGKLWFELIPENDPAKRAQYAETQAKAIVASLLDAKREDAEAKKSEEGKDEGDTKQSVDSESAKVGASNRGEKEQKREEISDERSATKKAPAQWARSASYHHDIRVNVLRNDAKETKESERKDEMGSRDVFLRLHEAAAAIIKKRKAFEKEKVRANVTRDTIEEQVAFDCGPGSNEAMRAQADFLRMPIRKFTEIRLSVLETLERERNQLRSEEEKWRDTVDAYHRDFKSHAASKQGDSDMESTNVPLGLVQLLDGVTEMTERRNAFEAEKKAILKELQRKEDGLRNEELRWEATVDAYDRIDGLASRSVPITGRLRKRRRVCYRDGEARESIQYKVGQVVEIQNGPDDVRATIVRVTGDSVTVRYHSDNFEETIIGEDRHDRILRIVDDDDASDEEPSKSSASTVTPNARMSVPAPMPASVARASRRTSKYKGVNFHSFRKDGGEKWHARLNATKFSNMFSSEEEAAKAYDAEARKKFGDSAVTNFSLTGDFNPNAKRTTQRTASAVGEHGPNRSIGILEEEEPSKSSPSTVIPNARMSVPAQIPAPAARTSSESSTYKGVSLHSTSKETPWLAQLAVAKFAKTYKNEEEAAKAYDEAAKKHFGDSAVTNFFPNGERNPNAKRTRQGTAVAVGAMSSPTASPVSARTSALLRVSPQSQKTARKKEFIERLDYLRRRGWKIVSRSGNHYTYEPPNGGKTFSRLDEAETHHKKHKQ
eukprot:g285.t1